MNIIHISNSNQIGGAARAATRIHESLLDNNINSKIWVNEGTDHNSDNFETRSSKFHKEVDLYYLQGSLHFFNLGTS